MTGKQGILKSSLTGSVINEIYNNSPLSGLLNKNDILIEVQKDQSSPHLNLIEW